MYSRTMSRSHDDEITHEDFTFSLSASFLFKPIQLVTTGYTSLVLYSYSNLAEH
jgi:hypothetical protein